jgi:hypothetical protein
MSSFQFEISSIGNNVPFELIQKDYNNNSVKKTQKNIPSSQNLTQEQQKELESLKETDRKVRAHEQAHIAAGGAYIRGGATFEYKKGPDGKMYAVAGEVSIDTSPIKDNPQATITKMQVVKAAALAPADPSAQDRAVAAKASQEEAKARMELVQKQQEMSKSKEKSSHSTGFALIYNSKAVFNFHTRASLNLTI